MKIQSITPLLFIVLAGSPSLHAQINRWTGATSGNWNTNSNWANGVFPNSTGIDAIFDSAASNPAINLSAPVTFRGFYLYGGNYTLGPSTAEVLTIATGNWTQLGAGSFAVTNEILSTGNLLLNGTGTGNITMAGPINMAANSFLKWNTSDLSLTGTITSTSVSINTNTPALAVRAGKMTLSGNAMLAGAGTTGLIVIGAAATYTAGRFHDNSGAALVLDNTTTNITDRLGSRPMLINQRGLLELRGNAAAATVETSSGNLSVGGSGTRIRIAPGSGQAARLTFNSLVTPNGAIEVATNGNPTLALFQIPGGSTLGASGVPGGRLILTTEPVLLSSILRYGVVKDEASGEVTFATYDGSEDEGFPLGVSAFSSYDVFDPNTSTTSSNVDLSGSATLTASRNANAIRITPTGPGESLELGASNLRLSNAGGVIFGGGEDYAINGTGSFDTNFVASYLYINSNTLTVNSTFTRSSEMVKAGDGLLVINGNFNSGSGRHLGVDKGSGSGDDMQVAGPITGGSILNKGGLGTLALTGSGDSSGFASGISLNAGTLVLAKDSEVLQNAALGTGTFVLQGGTLVARGNAAVLANSVSLGQAGSGSSGNRILGDQPITFSGPLFQGSLNSSQTYPLINDSSATVTLTSTLQAFNANNASPVTSQFEFAGTGNTEVSGSIRNADPLFANAGTMITGLIKSGSGRLTLSGPNTNTGNTVVNAGYLHLDHANALSTGNLLIAEANYSSGMNAVVELGAGNTSFIRATGTLAGQVNLGGTSGNSFNHAGFASVSGTSTVNLGGAGAPAQWGVANFFNAGGALILGSPHVAGTLEFQNPIELRGNRTVNTPNGSAAIDGRITGIISNGTGGSRRLTKTGTGTLELTAENTYNGQTDVLEGALLVNNSAGNGIVSNIVQVAAGATVGGTGSINSVLNSLGTVAPGSNAIGTLTAASGLIGGSVSIELDASTSDILAIGTNLNLTGATLAITSLAPAAAASYVIATYTGSFTGNANSGTANTFASVTGLPSGYTIVHDTTLKQIRLESTGGGNAYDTWAGTFSGFTPTTANLDFDNDGIKNLLEFVFGGNPTINDSPSIRPVVTASGTNLFVSFNRSDISKTSPLPTTVTVQVSDNLVTWNPANDIIIGDGPNGSGPNGASYTVTDNGSLDLIEVTIPKLGADKKFARVVATR